MIWFDLGFKWIVIWGYDLWFDLWFAHHWFTHMCLCSPSSTVWYRPHGRGLAHRPYSWVVFALTAGSGPYKRRWALTRRSQSCERAMLTMGQVTLRYLMLPGLSWWGRGSTELFHLPCLLACFVLHVLWRLALETDLKIEREWRGTLQQTLDKEKAKAAKLQTDIQHLEETKKAVSYTHLTLPTNREV